LTEANRYLHGWRDRVCSREDALRAQLREARELLPDLLDKFEEYRAPDWACVQCRPDSDCLSVGFQCSYHAMRSWLARTSKGEAPQVEP
jgi:hypothetical protein